MNLPKWDQRIARAQVLARDYSFATDILWFYARFASLQKELYVLFERNLGNYSNSAFGIKLNDGFPVSRFGEFLSQLSAFAPAPLAAAARDLQTESAGHWNELLNCRWQNASHLEPTSEDAKALIAWMFLQPYAEALALRATPRTGDLALCPVCSASPLVGVLRPEGDGGKRSFICSVCATEWPYRRIVCPACGEEAVDKLSVYTAEQFKHVRVETCDTCRRYIKTIDLTKNGHAIPVVDELATIPLNLWAQEHQYTKLRANLLGL